MPSYVIVDLEMCNIPKGTKKGRFPKNQELIQIGAVRIDENGNVTDRFQTLVKPAFGKMDTYIEHLTGISRTALETAPSTQEAIEAFENWLPQEAVLVAWSTSDEAQLRAELYGKNIEAPILEKAMERCVDCQQLFSKKMHAEKIYRLSEALAIAEIPYEDGAHDALVDAHNTALLFWKIQQKGEWKVSRYYVAEGQERHLAMRPFAALAALIG